MSATTANRLNVAVTGASGRMGQMLIGAVHEAADCHLVGALDRADSPVLGQDAGAGLGWDSGVAITGNLSAGLAQARCLIDFTRPEASMAHLQACHERGVAMVIGTTGFSAQQLDGIRAAAADIPVVLAPNMSVGVNVTFKLVQMAARALGSYDIEIIEAHHRHKVDAPSGTAIRMGEIIAQELGRELDDCAVWARHGHTGERADGAIGFSTIRGGDIVGDHTAMFVGTGERIEITHRSGSRAGYAQGALMAARFVAQREHGFFDMFDVLNLR